MNLGQRVMLIAHWPECVALPPIGSIGEIRSMPDLDGDYYVLFPEYPCPVDDEPEWYAPPWALIPIDEPPSETISREAESLVE